MSGSPSIPVHESVHDMVRATDVSVAYGPKPALDRVSFRVPAGVTCLLGPNGAGKSTLIRLIATIDPLRSGRIVVAGNDLGDAAGRRRVRSSLGYLPQTYGFWPGFTVLEFLVYFAWVRQVPRRERRSAALKALAAVDLVAEAGTTMKKLSGGMLRRAGIAQALVADPAVVVLDEPFAGLDPRQRAQLRELIVRLGSTRTVLLSTHHLDDLAALCDHVVVLDSGRLAFHGSLGDFLERGGAQGAPADGASAYTSLLGPGRSVPC
ncbi:ABC transporter ATP-binding protein [Streptomyces netropsis]|uniref:ABC transporter ATP-binding protein n=1 Tax=Streptomyces netropsis TaxID=55404 RepID=UPI0037A5C5C0